MLHLQCAKTARSQVALCDVFEAFVEAGAPLKRSIGFGVFDPTGTMVDRLLAVLPKQPVLLDLDMSRRPTQASTKQVSPIQEKADE